jgi:hypothetical protein
LALRHARWPLLAIPRPTLRIATWSIGNPPPNSDGPLRRGWLPCPMGIRRRSRSMRSNHRKSWSCSNRGEQRPCHTRGSLAFPVASAVLRDHSGHQDVPHHRSESTIGCGTSSTRGLGWQQQRRQRLPRQSVQNRHILLHKERGRGSMTLVRGPGTLLREHGKRVGYA